jgi:hypothetical protein
MEYKGILIALTIAACITTYMHHSKKESKQSETKPDHYQSIIIFIIIFLISYMMFILISDTKDNTNVYNNIKIGDPPF